MKSITVNIVDVHFNDIYPGEILIENGLIKQIIPIVASSMSSIDFDYEGLLLPGFIDGHIHIESTMLTPGNFAKAVIPHGTTSVVADSHEIANVLGINGIKFMIENGKNLPFDFYYTAPSCVPVTPFETSGDEINSEDLDKLLALKDVLALGEMMNFQGVIFEEPEVLAKISKAKKHKKPIDGHAPLLTGEDLEKYISKGISTEHECSSFDEAIEKKKLGMKIMVREGSSAKNMDDLLNLNDRTVFWANNEKTNNLSKDDFEIILKNPIFDFLVSDDKDAHDLIKGHLDLLVKKAIEMGIYPIEAVKMVTLNPANHYGINAGSFEIGRKANFVLIDNFNNFNVLKTFVNGEVVYEDNQINFDCEKPTLSNTCELDLKTPEDFEIKYDKGDSVKVRVISADPEDLITDEVHRTLKVENNNIQADIERDVLKLAVVERYGHNFVANGFVECFDLKHGAIASSVAHDSHNIVVVGTNSVDIAEAVNLIAKNKGGLAVVCGEKSIEELLPLPIAGLMSDEPIETVAANLEKLHNIIKDLGSNAESPFMTLSFMTLLVIPNLKLSDQGLFNVNNSSFVDVIVDD